MKYIKLFEDFDPYELMMIPPYKKSEMLMWEISYSKELNIELIRALIALGADLEWVDDIRKMTLLGAAVANAHFNVIQMLLEAGADPNQKVPHRGDTALIIACDKFNPSIRIIELLIEYGVKLNDQDFDGNTALHLLSQENKFDAVELLLSHRSNPNIQNDKGNTPLHISGSNKMAHLLIKHGADESITNNNGHTYDEVTDDELYGWEDFDDEDE